MKDVLAIVNPAARAGRARRQWPRVRERLRAAGLDFDEALTTRAEEATLIARKEVRRNRPVIAAVGGDGTLHEVVNGFFEQGEALPTESALALIPLGTGGDTRRTFGIPVDPEGAARVIRAGIPHAIDAGRVTFGAQRQTRHFIDIGETGIGGDVSDRVNRMPKLFGGRVSFLTGTMLGLAGWKHRPMHVLVDGREERDLVAQAVTVANCQYYGGGMRAAPRAVPDDGLFDVIITAAVPTRLSLRGLRKIYAGTHLEDPKLQPYFEYFLAKRVEVTSEARVLTALDGEVVNGLPVVYEVQPRALQLMVPRKR